MSVECLTTSVVTDKRSSKRIFDLLLLIEAMLTCISLSPLLQSTGLPQQNFMRVATGNISYSAGGDGEEGATSQALAATAIALADSGPLSSPQTHHYRNINSPQRPPSTGSTGVCMCAFSMINGEIRCISQRTQYISMERISLCMNGCHNGRNSNYIMFHFTKMC